MLGPSTALYEPFLKHCTLTNKAVGTIWRALSKPPQRRQGPDLCPLWLLVGTPSAIIPELAFSRAEHSRPYSDVAKYIFDIYYLLTKLFVNWFLWPLLLVWLLVCCLYKEVYLQIFKCVSFWIHGCCGEWEGEPVNLVNHTNRMDVVCCHSIDCPQSVPQPSCNRTLQFSGTFRLNRNGVFHSLVTQFCHLKILLIFKCYMFATLMSL